MDSDIEILRRHGTSARGCGLVGFSVLWWRPETRTMHAPLTEFEAQVALAEMIVKLLAKEDSTKPRVSPSRAVIIPPPHPP